MSKPLISIIIATLHRSQELHKALLSILSNSCLPHQVIIVDQSDDHKTRDIVNLMNNSLVVYYHFNHKSLTKARNFGLQKIDSDTDVVVFFDDDIVADTDCLTNIATYIKNHKECLGGALNIHTPSRNTGIIKKIGFFLLTGALQFDRQFITNGGFSAMFLQQPQQSTNIERCNGCAMFFRSSIIKHGFLFSENFEKYSSMEDVFFSYAIYRRNQQSLHYIANAKVVHNESPSSRIPHLAKIRQNIIHRYIFVRKYNLSICLYMYTTFILMMFDILSYRDVSCIIGTYMKTCIYIMQKRKHICDESFDFNEFIFS